MSSKEKIKYVSNPDLTFVKKGYKGNILIDGVFSNTDSKEEQSFQEILKWKLATNPQKEEKKNDAFQLKIIKDITFKENKEDVMVWLGHSSFYIRLNGMVYLTDPIMSDLPTGKRKVANPYLVKELGKIDYILLSHAHFDHLDIPTLKKIVSLNLDVEILCPLGAKKLFKNKIFHGIKKQEAGWYQTFKSEINTITFLPAKHWNRRGLFDFNKTLWGSFALSSDNLKIYFAGDTGQETNFFSEINKLYNGFDFCFIPIGAYRPEYIMKNVHINPQEALQIFQTINGKHFIPMHYGTFDLTDEPLGEPVGLLTEEAKQKGIEDKLCITAVGKPLYLKDY